MELQVGVKILLENEEGKFLVLRRNPEKYPWSKDKDSHDIIGGRITTGIPLMQNLRREVKEEVGLKLKEKPELISAQDIIKPDQDKHVIRLTYLGIAEGEVKLSEEHSEYKWMDVDEILALESLDEYSKEVFSRLFSD